MKNILLNDLQIIVASNVGERDGIGIEVWSEEKLLIEVFRDAVNKECTISLFVKDLP